MDTRFTAADKLPESPRGRKGRGSNQLLLAEFLTTGIKYAKVNDATTLNKYFGLRAAAKTAGLNVIVHMRSGEVWLENPEVAG